MMIAFGLILPIGTAVWWIRKKKEKVRTVVIGALTWLLFAVLLESIPKLFLLNQATPIGRAVLGNTALAAAVGSLLAGIFEETGRLLAFKTVLRNRDNKETSISHGIGHGGFEALYILVMTGVQYLVYASMINAGRFSELIEAAAAQGADVSALESLPSVIASITPLSTCLTVFERIFAMLLHVGLSILVFYAVKMSRTGLYFLAVLLHALFDVPAALYQLGVIRNVFIVEAMLAVYSVVFFIIIKKKLYDRDVAEQELPL